MKAATRWFGVLLVLVGHKVALAANTTWTGCGPFGNEGERLTIDKSTVICLQVGNAMNWGNKIEYLRLTFQPKVDQYSRFHVKDSYKDLVQTSGTPWSGANISVGVASQQKISFLRQYYNANTQKIYPHLTAIIDVDKGRVKGVTWDDACVFCGGGECEDVTYDYDGVLQSKGSAGQPVGGCPKSASDCAADNTECDLLIYAVWTGTDTDGRAFQSSASRFSMFPAQKLRDRFTRNLPNNRREL